MNKSYRQTVQLNDWAYPPLLRTIPDPPKVLQVWGNPSRLHTPMVAVVGSRAATSYGKRLASEMAHGLALAGITVVSGGSVGVDAAAHRSATIHADRRTVVVLGCGLSASYPAANQGLFRDIAAGGGAVVSEYSPDAPPEPHRFPERNRLIAGMCLGVVIVEAGEKSGSLNIASWAADFGREVMAAPGPVESLKSRGCHALIQDGAALVETADQVLTVIRWEERQKNWEQT